MTAPAPRAPWPIGRVHWLGIATLYRREAKRYLRWWFEFITQPLVSTGLFVLVFHLALGPEGDEGAGEAAFTYLLPGLLIYSVLMQAAASTLYSLVFDKIEGALADILMPPLTPGEFAAGYLMSALTAAAATAAIVLPIVLLAGLGLPADPLTVAVFATLGCAELALCGIAIATVAKKWDQAEAFVSFGLTPAAFLSGVFAPVSALPDPLPAII
ncbi:MAG: ABC transporter permease, partial [Rhodospirillaceae bacterium]|nr:ABC transporter permease [Rhodospirillaceae bacterium]